MKNLGFRIIALRPLKGCHPDYLKILKEKEIYYFYNNFKIDAKDKITFEKMLPDNFYQINKIDINISAIVGKNGSGKSTLIELLFRTINNLAKSQSRIIADLNEVKNLKVELYFHTNFYYKVKIDNSKIEVYKYDPNGNIIKQPVKDSILNQFFYTIAINYSHYAYNVNDYENEVNWLDGLFHKNDGYQTPLVINPMRTDGNIDINNENHLVKSRLIGNLLRPLRSEKFSFRKLTDKIEAKKLKITIKESKENATLYELRDKKGNPLERVKLGDLKFNVEIILIKLEYVFGFGYLRLDKKKYKLAYDYLMYKVISIATKYHDYDGYFNKDEKIFYDGKLDDFILQLKTDESHITFKLRQVLNFLRYQPFEIKNQVIELDYLTGKIAEIRTRKNAKLEIAEFVPPPIFDVDILLAASEDTTTFFEFKRLSSGEKQMIYSVSSLLYHLTNLNSITTTKRRVGYHYVNIVLEEIELYFHPEMQRTYINYILESISRIELNRIHAINFCFVTHSPFILSDIPTSNILFLNEEGFPEVLQENTFGGNIHELLANGFFLNNGFIGEFAKRKIQSIIDALKSDNTSGKKEEGREGILQEIQIIGEPFLKEKLMEMYYKKYNRRKRIAELKAEIASLEDND